VTYAQKYRAASKHLTTMDMLSVIWKTRFS